MNKYSVGDWVLMHESCSFKKAEIIDMGDRSFGTIYQLRNEDKSFCIWSTEKAIKEKIEMKSEFKKSDLRIDEAIKKVLDGEVEKATCKNEENEQELSEVDALKAKFKEMEREKTTRNQTIENMASHMTDDVKGLKYCFATQSWLASETIFEYHYKNHLLEKEKENEMLKKLLMIENKLTNDIAEKYKQRNEEVKEVRANEGESK